jgi:hypothetical protein
MWRAAQQSYLGALMADLGQNATWRHGLATSEFRGISDIGRGRQHVRKVPQPDITPVASTRTQASSPRARTPQAPR